VNNGTRTSSPLPPARLAPSALRFYEGLGLITASQTAGNQRRYPRHMVRRVAFIRAGRQLDLELQEIRASRALLPSDRAPTKAQWSRAARTWQAQDRRAAAAIPDTGQLHRLRLAFAAPCTTRRTPPGSVKARAGCSADLPEPADEQPKRLCTRQVNTRSIAGRRPQPCDSSNQVTVRRLAAPAPPSGPPSSRETTRAAGRTHGDARPTRRRTSSRNTPLARPVRGRPCKADGYADRPGGPGAVRYLSVDPATQRSTARQGDTGSATSVAGTPELKLVVSIVPTLRIGWLVPGRAAVFVRVVREVMPAARQRERPGAWGPR